MPEITLTISDDDLVQLEALGGPLSQTARRVAERMLHRNLTKTSTKPPQSNRERAADRSLRHLELLRVIQAEYGGQVPRSLIEKQSLARRFKVAWRTMYRDLDIVEEVLKTEALNRGS